MMHCIHFMYMGVRLGIQFSDIDTGLQKLAFPAMEHVKPFSWGRKG